MDDVKSYLASKTVWGGVIAVLSAIAGVLGHGIAPADQTAIVDALASIGGAIGGILAVYGRIKAEKKIG